MALSAFALTDDLDICSIFLKTDEISAVNCLRESMVVACVRACVKSFFIGKAEGKYACSVVF